VEGVERGAGWREKWSEGWGSARLWYWVKGFGDLLKYLKVSMDSPIFVVRSRTEPNWTESG
jgi:hypothetical protein